VQVPGPIDSLRFVHGAILTEADDLESALASATPSEAGALADRLDLFGHLVDGHTRGEEHGLFPRLVEHDEAIAETYLFDHVEERELFAELSALARDCAGGDEGALARLRRQMVALASELHSHVAKENELILPRVAAAFTPEEQGRIVGDILSVFTPDDTAAAVPWIVARLDPDTAARYVDALSAAMPPPVFEAAKGWIRGGISDEHWVAVLERAPVLAGGG
jgi:iron-sulfur cluster repair protein YtfE (RIC family)